MFVGWEGVGLCLLSAHRLLVREAVGLRRRQEGLRGQPDRRLWLPAGHVHHLFGPFGSLNFKEGLCRGRKYPWGPGSSPPPPLPLFWGHTGKIGSDSPIYLASPDAMGRSHSGVRLDPRGPMVTRRRLYGGPLQRPLRPGPVSLTGGGRGGPVQPLLCRHHGHGPIRHQTASWPTPTVSQLAICSWPAAWAPSSPPSSTS